MELKEKTMSNSALLETNYICKYIYLLTKIETRSRLLMSKKT